MKKRVRNGLVALSILLCPALSQASSGTEGASFLDIPVGAGPAAMGAAYSALAADAYAPIYNPAGLGFLPSTQLAAQHLNYLDTIRYEYASVVHPLHKGRSIGASVQYLTSGDIPSTDNTGASIGSFSSHYAAYNLSVGQRWGDHISLGMTGKLINASMDGVSANAYAADFGGMYEPRDHFRLAAVLSNVGTKLTFLNNGDSLPMAFHLGAQVQPTRSWNLAAEGVYRKTGLMSGHFGVEWMPMSMVALRAGYRTDTTKMLSPLAGLTTGIGLKIWGHELAYAWLPYGELGNTQYLSFLLRFGEAERARWNLVYLPHGRPKTDVYAEYWVGSGRPYRNSAVRDDPEARELTELLEATNPELRTASMAGNTERAVATEQPRMPPSPNDLRNSAEYGAGSRQEQMR